MKQYNVPILFITFNRPDITKKVFNRIRDQKPAKLFIASDGPRRFKPKESEQVLSVRKYLEDNIDWNCEVEYKINKENRGCRLGVSEAITWFFQKVDYGIILEDDCLPSTDFFSFCEIMLRRYYSDNTVYAISGDNHGFPSNLITGDYAYSKYPLIWGWASWARVWRDYDVLISDWREGRDRIISRTDIPLKTRRFWKVAFDEVYNGKIDTWDYQFVYLVLSNRGKCVIPGENLISNIGFGEGATHTHNSSSELAELEIGEIHSEIYRGVFEEDSEKMNEFLEQYFAREVSFFHFFKKIYARVNRIFE